MTRPTDLSLLFSEIPSYTMCTLRHYDLLEVWMCRMAAKLGCITTRYMQKQQPTSVWTDPACTVDRVSANSRPFLFLLNRYCDDATLNSERLISLMLCISPLTRWRHCWPQQQKLRLNKRSVTRVYISACAAVDALHWRWPTVQFLIFLKLRRSCRNTTQHIHTYKETHTHKHTQTYIHTHTHTHNEYVNTIAIVSA